MPSYSTSDELKNALRYKLHNDQTIEDADLYVMLNQSQTKIALEAPEVLGPKEADNPITATVNTQEYNLDADFHQMVSIWNKTDGYELVPLNATEWKRYVESQSTITTGSPRYYRMMGFVKTDPDADEGTHVWKIRFYPTPDATYTIDYFYYWRPQAITSTYMGPICLLGFDELVLWGAVMIGREPNDPEGSILAQATYRQLLRDYKRYDPMNIDYTRELHPQNEPRLRTPGLLPPNHFSNY